MLETYLKWIAAHEKLLLVAVAGLALWFGIGRVDTLIANHDKANLTQATIVDKAQADKDATTAALALQQAEQYKVLAQQEAADKAVLVQQNIAFANALAARQKTDATLPPTELVARWNALIPAQVTVTPNGVTLPSVGAVATVQELEKVPVLTKQLANETQIVGDDAALLTQRSTQIDTLNTLVAGLQTKAVDDAKVCQEQIAVVKADAAKSKRRWFIGGFVTGLSLRGAVKIIFGI
jgi:hypothetical protein